MCAYLYYRASVSQILLFKDLSYPHIRVVSYRCPMPVPIVHRCPLLYHK